MKRPKPMPELPAGLHAQLHEPMLALHAALETEALWKAVKAVLRVAVPAHRVTLFLGHLGMGEARVVLTDPPIARPAQWYADRGKANPFTPYIEGNRGIKFYRFEDVLPERKEWMRSEFYQRFAKEEGWDKGRSVLYWAKREVTAMFSLYRSPKEKPFTAEDEKVLHYLYAYIGTAITRVQKIHTERLARRSLEDFNKNLPVGLVLVTWDFKVEFANHEAQRQCLIWNHGERSARALNPRDAFVLPQAVLASCHTLGDAVRARNPKTLTPLPCDVVALAHPTQTDLRARVSVHNNTASALARPRFLVVLDTRPGTMTVAGSGEPVSGEKTGMARNVPDFGFGSSATENLGSSATMDNFGPLRELSPREREIAMLVCEGWSNAEIASAE